MFFLIQPYEAASFSASHLQNPQNTGNAMNLVFRRTQMRMAVCTVHSKKAAGNFVDVTTGKTIARRQWTSEMKEFYKSKSIEVPKPPFVFKLTIVGWIFAALVVAALGMIVYQETKPPLPKPTETVAMEQKPEVGDIYFGHFEKYKEKGMPMGAEIGFGWFKISKVEGSDFYISKSSEMSKTSKPKEQLNSSDYETETFPALHLSEQTGYNIRFKSTDGLTEVYITDKK